MPGGCKMAVTQRRDRVFKGSTMASARNCPKDFASVFVLVLACSIAPLFSGCSGSKAKQAQDRADNAYNLARGNPLTLRAFLEEMPKGAELHYHLSGGVYAETWIRDAAEDGLCVNVAALSFTDMHEPNCGTGNLPVKSTYANKDQIYDRLVDAFSMRAFVPTPSNDGHDQFFRTFNRFGGIDARHMGEWLDEVASRAASQNEQYMELMVTPPFSHAQALASALKKENGWNPEAGFGGIRDRLLAMGLRDEIPATKAFFDSAETSRQQIEHCGEANESPACHVEVRYIYQVLRAFPPEVVFAQTLLGFEYAQNDPRVVGINYVQPEDDPVAMENYALGMRQIDYLHGAYPKLHISLHAGELAPGMVPPDGLRFHIRMAIETGHAERIGHGVDVMYEDRPYDLLREMAANHVMVEINLTSNDVILGIAGYEHPFRAYRKYNVPVSLSTDDEGVSRIDLTHEYELAVETYALSYADVKQMVRTGIAHTFLPGASLWQQRDKFVHTIEDCSGDALGADNPSRPCATFLKSSEHAQQEWELERRFRLFESTVRIPVSPPAR
jgi:adenosine deaminase